MHQRLKDDKCMVTMKPEDLNAKDANSYAVHVSPQICQPDYQYNIY